jgi:hypothetical protein
MGDLGSGAVQSDGSGAVSGMIRQALLCDGGGSTPKRSHVSMHPSLQLH